MNSNSVAEFYCRLDNRHLNHSHSTPKVFRGAEVVGMLCECKRRLPSSKARPAKHFGRFSLAPTASLSGNGEGWGNAQSWGSPERRKGWRRKRPWTNGFRVTRYRTDVAFEGASHLVTGMASFAPPS